MISKKRLNKLINAVACITDQEEHSIDWDQEWLEVFARTLLKAVEAESEVVGWLCNGKPTNTDYPFKGDRKLITLPPTERLGLFKHACIADHNLSGCLGISAGGRVF